MVPIKCSRSRSTVSELKTSEKYTHITPPPLSHTQIRCFEYFNEIILHSSWNFKMVFSLRWNLDQFYISIEFNGDCIWCVILFFFLMVTVTNFDLSCFLTPIYSSWAGALTHRFLLEHCCRWVLGQKKRSARRNDRWDSASKFYVICVILRYSTFYLKWEILQLVILRDIYELLPMLRSLLMPSTSSPGRINGRFQRLRFSVFYRFQDKIGHS